MKAYNQKIVWLTEDRSEAARVIGTYLEVRRQFFQHHEFLVLPYAATDSVYLPEIDFTPLSKLKPQSSYHTCDYKSELLKTIESQLASIRYPKRILVKTIEQIFSPIQPKLLQSLHTLFPDEILNIRNISIITTAFGTESSFDHKKVSSGHDIFVWVRTTGLTSDEIIAHLIHSIVSAIVLIQTKTPDSKDSSWKQRETTIDFLLEHTLLHRVWKNTAKTVSIIESKQKAQKKIKDSHEYLRKLEVLLSPPKIVQKDQTFVIGGHEVFHLSKMEYTFMEKLYTHKNSHVSKDELFELLYANGDGSDWALSKLIQRIRSKIESAGISYLVLITSRKQGYKLVSG